MTNRTLPLSQSQLLLWIGQEINSKSPLYNMVLTFDLLGAIDVSHFQVAFQTLVQQSDALRTVFEFKEGQPVQKIKAELPYEVPFLDWSNHPEKVANYKTWLSQRTQISFDLSACLFDCVLIKMSDDHFVWYLNQHHLITDAWAVSVIYKKVLNLYQLSLNGQLNEAPNLQAFQDYLEFEKMARNNPKKQSAHNYWKEKLQKLLPIPRFYGQTPTSTTTLSHRVKLDLGVERSQKIRDLSQTKGIRTWTAHLSMFNIFATVLYAYLHRVSGQDEIVIGSPAHNRSNLNFKDTIGLFIEIFPLLGKIEQEDSFMDLLKRVQTEVNSFLRYAQPGAANSDTSRRFNVILNYIHAEFSDFGDIPMRSEWVHPEHCDPRHHFRLQVHDMDGSGAIELGFDLNTSIFNKKLQALVPQHFLKLLDAFIENKEQQIAQVPLLSNEEFQALVLDFNPKTTDTIASPCVIDLFEQQVKHQPAAKALSFKTTSLSYQKLDERANQLAAYLHSKNIGAGHRVAICLKRSPDFIISVLAVLKTGAAYIPIPSNYPNQRVRYIIEDSQSNLLISQATLTNCMDMTGINVMYLDTEKLAIEQFSTQPLHISISPDAIAYLIYTSGSTGQPKGVMISHEALSNYITWASDTYLEAESAVVPLFTTIGFDLTITSTFLPLISGGQMRIYEETSATTDLSILDVLKEDRVDFIKLTPSHLAFLKEKKFEHSRLKTIVVGGEDFKTDLAQQIHQAFDGRVDIYNEYGPTEATVGCIVHHYQSDLSATSVPIGLPIQNMQAYVLDDFKNPVPQGKSGLLYLGGIGLAEGYWNRAELTTKSFIEHPFEQGTKVYNTGDIVRLNTEGQLEFLGRKDQQIKISGRRIELGEIEAALLQHPNISNAVVEVIAPKSKDLSDVCHCDRCGLPSNYPNVEIDESGICELCHSFENYQQKVHKYFKTEIDLRRKIQDIKANRLGDYDCIVLLSGGKDSSYALAKMVENGAKALAFTLDNGYISEQAKANIRRVVAALEVDHVFGRTPAMNAIFVDSLHRYSNVCNGCFKTIYTLSIQLALEKKIPYIITGLSRGQFFETRLTEELFRSDKIDIQKIDDIILDARKAYHRTDDAVNQLLDATATFEKDEVFEKVQFLDFYRYMDVSMDDMMTYLETRLPWSRPTDTGRSTNCLINQVGIHVHKTKEGFSNYAFPYSWDVRVGHKTREGALEEINEYIDVEEVQRIMDEIGYTEINNYEQEQQLAAYFTADSTLTVAELQSLLSQSLPNYMVPSRFSQLEELPLSPNGKIDRTALQQQNIPSIDSGRAYVAPQTDVEELVSEIWEEVLNIPKIGIHDNFLELGGTSLLAIRIIARLNEAIELELPVTCIFDQPTIMELSAVIEGMIMELMEA